MIKKRSFELFAGLTPVNQPDMEKYFMLKKFAPLKVFPSNPSIFGIRSVDYSLQVWATGEIPDKRKAIHAANRRDVLDVSGKSPKDKILILSSQAFPYLDVDAKSKPDQISVVVEKYIYMEELRYAWTRLCELLEDITIQPEGKWMRIVFHLKQQ